jgi:hypothetical protein
MLKHALTAARGDRLSPARLMMRADQTAIRRHELAHCDGWPADYPGGRRNELY